MSNENRERTELASSPCSAGEAEEAYMGYADSQEILAFLNLMLEAERAGAQLTLKLAEEAGSPETEHLLRHVHKDEAYCCKLLIEEIEKLDGTPSGKTGDFYGKVMALEGEAARLQLLNKGQAWVARKTRDMLPRIKNDALHARLTDMLLRHDDNIALMDRS